MPKTPPSPLRVLVITGFALSCFDLLMFLWLAFGGPVPLQPKGYRIEASFDDATQLADEADVRVAGVSIGKVVDKRLDPAGNRTVATLELDPEYAPLHSDAKAILRTKSLLGETFVEVTLGTKQAKPLQEGATLDGRNVSDAVDFDEFLRTFDKPTRKYFQQFQATAAKAGEGQAQNINDALGNLPTFVDNAGSVVDILNDRRDALRSLVRGTTSTFEQLTRNEGALRNLVVDNRDVFQTLSSQRENLTQSVQAFPAFLRESRATLSRLSQFSRDTTPLVRDLKPVLEDAQPTLASLRTLSPDLQALFVNLRPLITQSRSGLPALTNVLQGLDPTLASLGPFLQQVNPILEYLEYQQPTVADFLDNGPSALALKIPPTATEKGTNGHVLPQLIVTGGQSLNQTQRSPENRGNAYFPSGALANPAIANPANFTLPAFDCLNSVGQTGAKANGEKPPTPDGSPGCLLATDVTLQGKTQRFPNLVANDPGGISKVPRSSTDARSAP